MSYGLSTYAYFWRISDKAPRPLTLDEMLAQTRELGGEVFQICDYPLIETYDDERLDALRATAAGHGITLELGTRGVGTEHLAAYLRIARRLGVTLVRSMLNTADHRPDVAEATAPYVVNIHVKDFSFSRRDGWVGFTFAGCLLGEGLHDHGPMTATVRPDERGINQIVEHWLPWQGDFEETARLEDRWTRHSINTLLRSK